MASRRTAWSVRRRFSASVLIGLLLPALLPGVDAFSPSALVSVSTTAGVPVPRECSASSSGASLRVILHVQPCRSTRLLLSAAAPTSSEGEETGSPASPVQFTIRNCKYSELGTVADIIIASFYSNKAAWKTIFRLAELNRLQTNFAYPDQHEQHRMLVAVTQSSTGNDGTVIGFCDIDARPCRTVPLLPRPYLSDLSVAPDYRRQGVAQSLIRASEEFLLSRVPVPYKDIYIRVQESNTPAATMYEKLNYNVIERQTEKDLGSVLVLYKKLDERSNRTSETRDDQKSNCGDDTDITEVSNNKDYYLDYVEP